MSPRPLDSAPSPAGRTRIREVSVWRVMEFYPRIFMACHERHVRDPRTRRLVSEHQASILAHLDEVHPISLNELASHMGVTAGTMSVAVSRLAGMGYIRRRRDEQDTRRLLLRLSAAGARVRDAQSVLSPTRVEAMLANLDLNDLERAIQGLSLLAAAADRLGRAPKFTSSNANKE